MSERTYQTIGVRCTVPSTSGPISVQRIDDQIEFTMNGLDALVSHKHAEALASAMTVFGHRIVPAALLEAVDEFLDASERHREATSGELRVIEAGLQLERKRKAYWTLLDARKALPS